MKKIITFILLFITVSLVAQNKTVVVNEMSNKVFEAVGKSINDKNYNKAKESLQNYFATNPDKSSKEFQDLLILYIAVNKKIEDEKEGKEQVSFAIIEEVPVFPGCKGSRKEKAACLNVSMRKHVGRYFNIDGIMCVKFDEVEISEDVKEKVCVKEIPKGKVKMFATFRINKNGEIDDVKVRAPYNHLKKEVLRVINKLPKMKPGKQRGKAIGVRYTLPISFNVK